MDLEERLSDALGAQRMDGSRADAFAARVRRAIAPARWRWMAPLAAAAAVVALAAGLLSTPGRHAEVEATTVVSRLDQVDLLPGRRRLEPGAEYRVPAGEYVRTSAGLAGPGTLLRVARDGSVAPVGAVPDASELLEGLRDFQAGRWDEAGRKLARAPGPDAAFYRVAALGRAGRLEEAVRGAGDYLAAHPGHRGAELAGYFRAVWLRHLGREEESRGSIAELKALHPSGELAALADAHLAAGDWAAFQAAWSARDWAAGARALERLLAATPDAPVVRSGDARFYLVACVGNAGDAAHALELAGEFLRRHPGHPGADLTDYFRAVHLQRLGRAAEGAAAARAFLESRPSSPLVPQTRQLLDSLR